jgi:hypothetical protein
MPTIEVHGKDLLDLVKQMTPEEYDAFMEKAVAARPRTCVTTLSAEEAKLIPRITRGRPPEMAKRYAHLIGRPVRMLMKWTSRPWRSTARGQLPFTGSHHGYARVFEKPNSGFAG